MDYNSIILHCLSQFKSKVGSLDTSQDFPSVYKSLLQELNSLETIIHVHSQKTGLFSVFLPEIRDLSLKLASLKRLHATPKKKNSFFSMQLAKAKAINIEKVKAKPLECDFFKKGNEENMGPTQNEPLISKKKQKLETLVQDRLAGVSSGNKFFKPVICQTNKESTNNWNKEQPLANRDPFINSKDPYNPNPNTRDTHNFSSNNNFQQQNQRRDPFSANPPRNASLFPINSDSSNPPMFQPQAPQQRYPQKPKPNPPPSDVSSGFVTAKDQLRINGNTIPPKQQQTTYDDEDNKQPTMNLSKRFQPPYKAAPVAPKKPQTNSLLSRSKISEDKLKNLDQKMVEVIESEILDNTPKLAWSDIAGLEAPKTKIIEMIVWPFSNPEIFTGIRAPPRGLLLFGPPGTGKTMIGKAIASDTNFTFFSISASSLTSKWVGEGEKMVKTLFLLAAAYQPAVVFIDEVDSLLCSRSENENEASRRIKTEFLCQMEGASTNSSERLLFIGATNRPQELDDAALRRFVKKLYIPLPNSTGRREFLKSIIKKEVDLGNKYELSETEIEEIVGKTKGYSGADLRNLCAEAALNPLRGGVDISRLTKETLRPTNLKDFIEALSQVKPTVSQKDLKQYLDWNRSYGTVQFSEVDLEN